MRNKLLSILLISSFLLGSFPTFAEESLDSLPDEEQVDASLFEVEEVKIDEPVSEIILPEDVVSDDLQTDPTTKVASTSEPAITEEAYIHREGSITLPNGCIAVDASGQEHVFTPGSVFLAICALVEAKEAGIISDFVFEDYGWGFMLSSVEGVSPEASEFWELRKNGEEAIAGVRDLEVTRGDTLTFTRTDWTTTEEEVYDRIVIHIDSVLYDVTVPSQCTATAANTGTTTYTFPLEDTDAYFALCALIEARNEGMVNELEFDYYSPGAFISRINGTASNGSIFWALWHNDELASVGAEVLEVQPGDIVSLRYSDATTNWPPIELDERYDFRIAGFAQTNTGTSTDETGGGTGGNGSESPEDETFDLAAAYNFLKKEQNDDGSWDSELVTAWAAFALAAQGPAGMKSSLTNYFREEKPSFDSALDYERHAMALMALNVNPYTGGPDDYITPIVESFDGTQIDDKSIVNDDIFALFPLLHAGYSVDDEIIQKITAFIVSKQSVSGSWVGSVDVTAAAMQALSEVSSLPGVSSSLRKAEDFLRKSQGADGGFDDPFSTTWAIQGIKSVGQSADTWTKGNETPLTYLASHQQDDGGLTTTPSDYSTRAWATAYAIPAVKGYTWNDLMREFKKPTATAEKAAKDEAGIETATTTDSILPEAEVLVAEPLIATTSAPAIVQTAKAAVIPQTNMSSIEEEVVNESEQPMAQPAAVGATGAWEWIKKLVASIWKSIAGIF